MDNYFYELSADEDGYEESLPVGYETMQVLTDDPDTIAEAIGNLPMGYAYMFKVFEWNSDPDDLQSEILNIQNADEWLDDYN